MNRFICGVAVDEDIYKEYQNRKYKIGDEEKPLRTIEIMEKSKDYEEFPDIQAAAKEIIAQVRQEVKEYYAAKDGREEYIVMKHDTFDGYLKDLQAVHAKVAPERIALKEKWDAAQKRWQETQRNSKIDADDLVRENVKYLDTQEEYKNRIQELKRKTQEEILAVQMQFDKHITDFYSANGNRINDAIVRLLNSGIKLTDSEINNMVEQNKSNPTMLRLISDHCDKQRISNDAVRMYGYSSRKGGEDEREIFQKVASMVMNAVSDNEVTSSVWSQADSHFKQLSDEQIGVIGELPVRPEASGVTE